MPARQPRVSVNDRKNRERRRDARHGEPGQASAGERCDHAEVQARGDEDVNGPGCLKVVADAWGNVPRSPHNAGARTVAAGSGKEPRTMPAARRADEAGPNPRVAEVRLSPRDDAFDRELAADAVVDGKHAW